MFVQVPISVVHRKGAVALDGTDALVLYVYGAYGLPADADFDATRLSLLDRCCTKHAHQAQHLPYIFCKSACIPFRMKRADSLC